MRRSTLMIAVLGLALLGSVTAQADEAAGHYNLALQLKREGKTPEAIAECEKAISLRADYAAAHMTLRNRLYASK